MARNVLETIQGIDIFPLISLVIFFGFFVIMIFWVVGLDKSYLNEASQLPMKDDNDVKEPETTISTKEGK